MYTVCVEEEWPINSGYLMTKQHRVKGTVRQPYSEIPRMESYTFISEESLPTQLKTIATFKKAKALMVKDNDCGYQFWLYDSEKEMFVREVYDDANLLAWCLLRLGGQLIREYLNSVFYDPTYNISQIGFDDVCEINNPPCVSAQFTIVTKIANRCNLSQNTSKISRFGSVVNTDGQIREYKTDVYTEGYNYVTASAGMFVYLPLDKILTRSKIYDVTRLIEAYNKFNEIPEYKSEGIKT